jgi:hypothetical protein
LYAAMLVFVPLSWTGYSSAAHTVSELSAIGTPTRALWLTLATLWSLLYAAFGAGVWLVAERSRSLRAAGNVIVASAIIGLFWPPMHQREVLAAGGATATDTLHIAWTIMNGVLTLMAMAFSAAAMTKRFRSYAIVTMAILVAAGALTTIDAPGVDANLPTPWIGVWERINIGAWLLWVLVFSVMLRSREHSLRPRLRRPA